MSTPTSAPKKTLYHSELVARGVVELEITGEPTKSTFANRPDFIGVRLDGLDRTLNIENEAIKAFFTGQRGRRISVQATGGRGNAAIAEALADDSNPDLVPEMPLSLNHPKPPAASPPPIAQKPAATASGAESAPLTPPPQQAATRPPQQLFPEPSPRQAPRPAPPIDYGRQREEIEKTCKEAIRLRNVVKLAFVNALKLKKEIEEEWPGEKVSETQLQGFVGTLAIQLFRDGAQRGMPSRKVEMRDTKENGHAAPPADPAPLQSGPESSDLDSAREGYDADWR